MDDTLIQPFIEGSITTLKEMAGIDLEESLVAIQDGTTLSVNGFASIVGFAGNIDGWVMLSIDMELAKILACNILGEEYENIDEELICATVSETCNIIVGSANTVLNNTLSFRLRCSPPIMFFGEKSKVSLPQIKSSVIDLKSEYGIFKMIIAFNNKMFI